MLSDYTLLERLIISSLDRKHCKAPIPFRETERYYMNNSDIPCRVSYFSQSQSISFLGLEQDITIKRATLYFFDKGHIHVLLFS
jgi:hypothetical protein